ncbi:MAG TPA: transcription antitermination factor NusB [Bacteroidales bacterium]|nr:transcription antitermination factor NusB [Bacteroidales bacterium]
MLSRRLYRIKVFESLYAWFQGGEPRLEVAEKNMLQSIEKIYELYYHQLSFLLEVVDFYEKRTEEARHKFYPTEEELNPNLKFVNNALIGLLRNNKDLQEKTRRYRINWADEQEMVRAICTKIRNGKDHKNYLASPENSFEEDREFVCQVFRKYIARSTALAYYFEEKNIHWNIDFDAVAQFVMKTLRIVPEGYPAGASLAQLFRKEEGDDPAEDKKFVTGLFRKAIAESKEMEERIAKKVVNWELDRIALTDIILLKMALTELVHFPFIPVKVTLNEYIELSKSFSTPKSKTFINGLLDKLTEELTEQKLIRKKGRGLIK